MECLTINSIRPVIGLQWNLKVKDILPDSTSEECNKPQKTIRSSLCRIKGMEGLFFYLELNSQLNMLVKGHDGWSFQFMYAFAVVNERAFLVEETKKLKFLDFLTLSHLDSAEEVSFYCMVSAGPLTADSTSGQDRKDQPDMGKINGGLPSEVQVCADFEDIVYLHGKFNGHIPKFTINKAEELVTNGEANSVLKVLAVEYLIKSIEDENVSEILNIAIEQDLKVLQKRCSGFLSGCVIKKKCNEAYASDTSSEFESPVLYTLY